jgi:hypothetical protein
VEILEGLFSFLSYAKLLLLLLLFIIIIIIAVCLSTLECQLPVFLQVCNRHYFQLLIKVILDVTFRKRGKDS